MFGFKKRRERREAEALQAKMHGKAIAQSVEGIMSHQKLRAAMAMFSLEREREVVDLVTKMVSTVHVIDPEQIDDFRLDMQAAGGSSFETVLGEVLGEWISSVMGEKAEALRSDPGIIAIVEEFLGRIAKMGVEIEDVQSTGDDLCTVVCWVRLASERTANSLVAQYRETQSTSSDPLQAAMAKHLADFAEYRVHEIRQKQ